MAARSALAAALLAAAVAFVGAATASPVRTGLHGYVTRGPVTPVCRSDIPCEGPAAGITLTFTHSDGTRHRTKTGPKGFYRIALSAGVYRVASNYARDRFPYPAKIRVRAGHDDRLDFFLDTGIQ